AIKEAGPKETVARFGETYAFSPAVFAVYRDEPTLITFRNLQPDDAHDFMLTDPHGTVLMKVDLPSLTDTSYVFTFHRDGIFPFYCTMHQPAMSGQIIVLPPKSGGGAGEAPSFLRGIGERGALCAVGARREGEAGAAARHRPAARRRAVEQGARL